MATSWEQESCSTYSLTYEYDSAFTNISNTAVTILHTGPLNWEPVKLSPCRGYNPGTVGLETGVSISSRKTVVVKLPLAEPPDPPAHTHTHTQTYVQIVLFCCTTTTFTQVWHYNHAGGVLCGFGIDSEKLCFTIGATRLTALRHGKEGGELLGGLTHTQRAATVAPQSHFLRGPSRGK